MAVRRAQPSDLPEVADILADGFTDDPFFVWAFEGREEDVLQRELGPRGAEVWGAFGEIGRHRPAEPPLAFDGTGIVDPGAGAPAIHPMWREPR